MFPNRFTFLNTPINDLRIIERRQLGDSRGFLSRLFCSKEFTEAGWCKPIAQINHAVTNRKGTVRGMHFQYSPYAEMKLITCLRGAIWDVAVDLRVGSTTFLQWYAAELTATNSRAILIPEGFAHGFQTLSDACELLYLHSSAYTPEAESGLSPLDPLLSISWPLPISDLSDKDAQQLPVGPEFKGVPV